MESSSSEVERTRKTTKEDAEIFDEALALRSVGGDVAFLCEVVGLIQAALSTLLAEIREGMARRDLRAVRMSAHVATVAARNVSARRAHEAARRLEAMAGQGNLGGAQRVSLDLEQEVEQLQLALSRLRISRCSPPR